MIIRDRTSRVRTFFTASTWIVLALSLCTGAFADSADPLQDELMDLSLDELLSVEVTSVSRRAQSLSTVAAAIFVISEQDIRRSGATTIPDALRMVPGVNVAQIDGNKWAVTARGANGRFAAKLLVLMDGRTIYSPLFYRSVLGYSGHKP